MHNLPGWARLPAPQLGISYSKRHVSWRFSYHPHQVGVKHKSAEHNDLNATYLKMYYLYILQSSKNPKWLYKGCTSDLKRRVKEHNAKKNFSTAPHTPLKLIYYEAYILKEDAEAREKYLKTSMGKRVIKKQLSHFLN